MAENSRGHDSHLPQRFIISLWGILGVVILLATNWRWFGAGIPVTHDGQIHLTRIAQNYLTIKQGQFPPRWSGQLNNGFGYPVFNFNYPLFNLMAFPFFGLDWEAVHIYVFLAIAALVLGYGGMYLLLFKQTSDKAAFLGALFYSLNPYVAQLLYVRGSMGELSAYALWPWVVYFTFRLIEKKAGTLINRVGFVLAGSLFLLSHNIMVMLGGAGLTLYIGYRVWREGTTVLRRIMPWAVMVGLLGSFFWIPALLEKQFTVLDQAAITQGYRDHFVYLTQLFVGPWGYGFSYPGPVDGLSFALGLPQWLVIGLALLIGVKLKSRAILGYLLIILGLLCLTLTWTKGVWDLVPLSAYVQFPWRLLFFGQFMVALLAARLWHVSHKMTWVCGGITILLLVQAIEIQKPVDRISLTNQDLFYATETTSTLDENMPIGFDKFAAYALKRDRFGDEVVIFDQPTTTVTVSTWTGSRHVYTAHLEKPDRIVERVAFFPGWEMEVDGEKQPIEYALADYPGLITVALEPGTHTIETRFTQHTLPRMIGNGMSLLGLALLFLYCVWEGAKRLRRR